MPSRDGSGDDFGLALPGRVALSGFAWPPSPELARRRRSPMPSRAKFDHACIEFCALVLGAPGRSWTASYVPQLRSRATRVPHAGSDAFEGLPG